jgi:hypothetical protein
MAGLAPLGGHPSGDLAVFAELAYREDIGQEQKRKIRTDNPAPPLRHLGWPSPWIPGHGQVRLPARRLAKAAGRLAGAAGGADRPLGWMVRSPKRLTRIAPPQSLSFPV